MSGLCLVVFCFLFLLSEIVPKTHLKSVAAPLSNTMQTGDCKLLGVVRELFWGTWCCLVLEPSCSVAQQHTSETGSCRDIC